MNIAKLSSTGDLGDPTGKAWTSIPAEPVELAPVPLEAQPTRYVREAWKDRPYGGTAKATVAAASDGERLYLRVEWEDDTAAHGEFHDAAGALFPGGASTNGGALATLGTGEQPLAIWYWEHQRPQPLNLISRGPGVFRKAENGVLAASGALQDGRWTVVFSGPAQAAEHGKVGVAIWNGSNDERAGLAAVSQQWLPLELG